MKIIIFDCKDGCSIDIRGNRVQPVVGGASAMSIDRVRGDGGVVCVRG